MEDTDWQLLFQLEREVNQILAVNPHRTYFLVVIPIAGLFKEFPEWAGDNNHLKRTIEQVITAVYSNDLSIEEHYKRTASYVLYPKEISFKNRPASELPELFFSRFPNIAIQE